MPKFERRAEWVWRRRGLTAVPFNTANLRENPTYPRHLWFP